LIEHGQLTMKVPLFELPINHLISMAYLFMAYKDAEKSHEEYKVWNQRHLLESQV